MKHFSGEVAVWSEYLYCLLIVLLPMGGKRFFFFFTISMNPVIHFSFVHKLFRTRALAGVSHWLGAVSMGGLRPTTGPRSGSQVLSSFLGLVPQPGEPAPNPGTQTPVPSPRPPIRNQTSIQEKHLHGRTPISMARFRPPSGVFTYIRVSEANPVARPLSRDTESFPEARPQSRHPDPHPGAKTTIRDSDLYSGL